MRVSFLSLSSPGIMGRALLYPYFEFSAPEDIRTEMERNMDEIVRKSGVPLK